MKKLTLLLLACSLMSFSAHAVLTGFSMKWSFVDNVPGGNFDYTRQHCKCESVFIVNRSLYGPVGGQGPIPNGSLNGTYKVFSVQGAQSIMLEIPAATWQYNDTLELPVHCNYTFTDGPSNIRIDYIGSDAIGTKLAYGRLITRVVNVNAGSPQSICSGSSVTLTGSGATSYSWSPGGSTSSSITVSPTSATSYILTGTATFSSTVPGEPSITCSAKDTVLVSIKPRPVINFPPYELCTGDPLPVLYGPFASSYVWRRNATVLAGQTSASLNTATYGYGTYQLTATGSNGCVSTKSVSVQLSPSVAANLNANFYKQETVIDQEAVMTATAYGSGMHEWIVYPSSNGYNITGPELDNSGWTTAGSYTFDHVFLAGYYYRVIHNIRQSPCNEELSLGQPFYFVNFAGGTLGTGTEENGMVEIYPNPSTGIFTLHSAAGLQGTLEVTDISGKLVRSMQLQGSASTVTLDLTGFAKGIYVAGFTLNGERHVQKLILQ